MTPVDSNPTVLVVDDSETDLEIISIVCDAIGCRVDLARDGFQALKLYEERRHDIVLTDYVMEPMNGIYVALRITELNPDAVCLLVTGFPNAEVRRFADEGSVFDLITKPIQAVELKETLRLALNQSSGATQKVSGIALSNRMDGCPPLAVDNSCIRILRDQIAKCITKQTPVLVTGPRGVRKDEIVRFIHDNGPNAAKLIVKVSCAEMEEAAFRDDLIAEGGDWRSLLREAVNGTIVLDQIIRMPLSVQRDFAIQFDDITSKMHLIALSEDSLEDSLDQGVIDDEFYFKFTMDQIHVPPASV